MTYDESNQLIEFIEDEASKGLEGLFLTIQIKLINTNDDESVYTMNLIVYSADGDIVNEDPEPELESEESTTEEA